MKSKYVLPRTVEVRLPVLAWGWEGCYIRSMENKKSTEALTWADLIGNPRYDETLDWDDCYDREAMDYRRAERDGWGNQMVWDGR